MFKYAFYIIAAVSCLVPEMVFADVNIAVIAPKAGEYKKFGEELISGVETAVNEINDHGGLSGEKINLITVDDRCDDRIAVSTAQMMAVSSSRRDKISLVIGPFCSNAFNEVSDIYAKAHIFQIIPTAVSRREAQHSHKGLIKMVGCKERQAYDFFAYYQKTFPNQKVALVYDGDMRQVVEVAAALQEEFRKSDQAYNLKSFNFRNYDNIETLSTEILNSEIKIAYILGQPEEISQLARSLKREHKYFVVFTNRYQSDETYNRILGDLAEGSYFMALPSLKDNPAFTETLVRLRLLGVEPEGLSVYGYSAVRLWKELVEQSEDFSYEKLAETLKNGRFPAAWGDAAYNNGNPEDALPYGIYRLYGGEYTQVY